MKKEEIELLISPVIKFEDITNWALQNSTDWYNWVPIYTDKKVNKQYQRWLKEHGKSSH